ncbi:NAD(P)-binding protein [Cystobasidium minutum MCA 4210]|uniref:NAD(P)-binding protein n=1 Tax=Cystobasidium minutum MCA 4210 TaxID=1397322 RepID=UPI0034CF2B4D|eukprot:jgi/Rhomi1/167035/fgenesh1_kg.2_\
MSNKLCLTSPNGKLGGAVLRNILKYEMISPAQLVLSTSSSADDPKRDSIKKQGAIVRQASYDDSSSMEAALQGCDRLFLVSTPRISMDFNDAPPGKGREAHHFNVLEAAKRAGIKHVYYTSLGFGDDSVSGVMAAHLRTEAYLRDQKNFTYSIIREGLYNESWPLYLGHSSMDGKLERTEIPIAGDGPISWTAIDDLGVGTAAIIADKSGKYDNQIVTLSNLEHFNCEEVASLVSKYSGKSVKIKLVDPKEHVRYYVEERGLDRGQVEWWVKSYEALKRGECLKQDPLLKELLAQYGRKPIPFEETVKKMVESVQ